MAAPDLSEFEKLANPQPARRPCSVAVALETLDDAEQAQAKAAIAKPHVEIPTGAISKWFDRRGQRVSMPAITSHRKQTCACAARDD